MNTMSFYEFISEHAGSGTGSYMIQAHIFFLYITPSFPMSNQDQLKYLLGSVNISLGHLGLVNIGLDRLILVWIGYYWSRSVNISLDGLNVKKYRLISVRIG